MVIENEFGDSLSDLSAGLVEGMDIVPSGVSRGGLVQAAADKALSSGLKSIEFGDNNGTVATASAIESALETIDPETLR